MISYGSPNQKKRLPVKIVVTVLVLLLSMAFFSYQIAFVDKRPTFYAKSDELLVATVEKKQFQEHINVTGIMAPADSLFLDALEGGQVKKIFVDVGDTVKEGDPILVLENTDLEMDELLKEARIIEKEYELERARVNCSRLRHDLKEELIDLEFRLTQFKKKYHRNRNIAKSNYIAGSEFEDIEDSFNYWKKKRAALIETMAIEERLNEKNHQTD